MNYPEITATNTTNNTVFLQCSANVFPISPQSKYDFHMQYC